MTSRVTNIASSETGMTFKRVNGHSHDGVNSTLIDTTKYSLFDFTPALPSSSGDPRQLYRNNNLLLIKKFIVDTIEERVLNPQGIAIKANTITAREIVSGTITSNQLSANLILVNNIIQSNNYTAGSAGWYISYDGSAEFSNVVIRGTVISNTGNIGGWVINASNIRSSTGNSILNSNGYIEATSGKFTGQIESSTGNIAGWKINAANITSSTGNTILYNNGYIQATAGRFTGQIESTSGNIGGFAIGATTITSNNLTIASNGTITAGVTEGTRIRGDGYLQAIGGSGIRVMDSDGTTGTTQIFKSTIATGTFNGDTFSVPSSVTISSIGANITTSGNRPLILRRDYVASAKFISFVSTTSGSNVGHVGFANATGVAFETTSDQRLKENFSEITGALNIIKKIIPYSFNFIEDPDNKTHGFVAQQVYEHYPYPVSVGGDDPKDYPWTIDYSRFSPLLLSGIKDLLNKINILESKIEQLESRLKALEDV